MKTRKDNELLQEIKKIDKERRRARIKKELKGLVKDNPYQMYIIIFGTLFLIYYALK